MAEEELGTELPLLLRVLRAWFIQCVDAESARESRAATRRGLRHPCCQRLVGKPTRCLSVQRGQQHDHMEHTLLHNSGKKAGDEEDDDRSPHGSGDSHPASTLKSGCSYHESSYRLLSSENCLWVNLWSRFNLHGEQPRNGVWYDQRPS